MASEEVLIKRIMDSQVLLLNKYKLPSLFSYNNKFGNIVFGSKGAMTKFAREYDDDDWEKVFSDDLDDSFLR